VGGTKSALIVVWENSTCGCGWWLCSGECKKSHGGLDCGPASRLGYLWDSRNGRAAEASFRSNHGLVSRHRPNACRRATYPSKIIPSILAPIVGATSIPSNFILPAYDETQPVVKTQDKNAPQSFDVVPSQTPLVAPWTGSSLVPRRRACVGSNECASPLARRKYLGREEGTRRHGGQTCVVHVPPCCSTFREVMSLCTGQPDFREHGERKGAPVLKSSTNLANALLLWSLLMVSGLIFRSSTSHVWNSWLLLNIL
jgi:hypothetical protein